MRASISWWDLSRSTQTIDSLRTYLACEGVKPWLKVDGLLLKFWISDRSTNRWGAVMVWDSHADPHAPLPPNRATELIGYPPTERLSSEVEAMIGDFHLEGLSRQGHAFEHLEKI
jgi:hypothetical protein